MRSVFFRVDGRLFKLAAANFLGIFLGCLLAIPLQAAEPLFVDEDTVPAVAGVKSIPDASIKRFRLARLNPAATIGTDQDLPQPGARLVLNLFPDEQHTAVILRSEVFGPNRWTGYGRIEGHPQSSFLISMENQTVAAAVFIPNRGRYRILSEGPGFYKISQLNNARHLCAVEDHLPADHSEQQAESTKGVSWARLSKSLPPQVEPSGGNVSIVDVMVVYTPAALDGAGSSEAMNALIDLAVAEANTVYQNSLAKVRLRLVHRQMIDYVESGSLLTNLTRLRSAGDGFMDAVHPLREEHKADLVCLFTERADGESSGLAFTMNQLSTNFAANAFSVVKRADAVGSFLFAHEISHNLGCHHDRSNAVDEEGQPVSGLFDYSYGHKFAVNGTLYRTIMAYAPGEIIPFISNPGVSYLGIPTGLAEGATNAANNVATIEKSTALISSFYGAAVNTAAPLVTITSPTANAVLIQGSEPKLQARASDADGTIQRVEFYLDDSMTGFATTPDAGSLGSLFSSIWNNARPGRYALTALAYDNDGAVSASRAMEITLRPANDAFATRTPLAGESISVTGSNRAATPEPNEPQHAGNPGGSSVWYSWVAPKSGTIKLVATGEGMVPLAQAYRGVLGQSLQSVTHRFDFDPDQFIARIDFDVLAGTEYVIAIDALSGNGAPFLLTFAYEASANNDLFQNRISLVGEALEFGGTNLGATLEAGEPVHAQNQGGKSVWYSWTAPKSGTVIYSVTGTGFFPLSDVYLGSSVATLALPPGNRSIAFETEAFKCVVSFDAEAGKTYQIAVDGSGGGAGAFVFALSMPAPPANDHFANRLTVSGTSISINGANLYASREPGEPQHVGNAGGKSVWYAWTAPVSGPVTITCVGQNFYTLPDVYTGDALNSLQPAPGRSFVIDQQGGLEKISMVKFNATAFVTYAIAVDGFDNRSGSFSLKLEAENAPPRIDSFSLSNATGLFELRLTGKAGTSYVVYSSSDLKSWSEVSRSTFAGGAAVFTDPGVPGQTAKFYRVLPVP